MWRCVAVARSAESVEKLCSGVTLPLASHLLVACIVVLVSTPGVCVAVQRPLQGDPPPGSGDTQPARLLHRAGRPPPGGRRGEAGLRHGRLLAGVCGGWAWLTASRRVGKVCARGHRPDTHSPRHLTTTGHGAHSRAPRRRVRHRRRLGGRDEPQGGAGACRACVGSVNSPACPSPCPLTVTADASLARRPWSAWTRSSSETRGHSPRCARVL